MAAVPVLIVSGTVGAGKSTVGMEIHELLSQRRRPHAFVDRDALSYAWPQRSPYNEALVQRNLASLWQNYKATGAERLVVAGVVEDSTVLEAYRRTIPGASLRPCRLTAPIHTREARLRGREQGPGLGWHLRRTEELEGILQQAALEDFIVENDGRLPQQVAVEVLRKAGWLELEEVV